FVNGLWWESLIIIKDYQFKEQHKWEKVDKLTANQIDSLFDIKHDISDSQIITDTSSVINPNDNYIDSVLAADNNHFERFKLVRGGVLFKPSQGCDFNNYDESFLAQMTAIMSFSVDKEISAGYLNELSDNLRDLAQKIDRGTNEQSTIRSMYFDYNLGVNRKLGLLRMLSQATNAGIDNGFLVVMTLDQANGSPHNLNDEIKVEFLKAAIKRIARATKDAPTLTFSEPNEFSFLIINSNEESVIRLLKKLEAEFQSDLVLNNYHIQCKFSAGYSSYPSCSNDPDTLYRMAQIANFQALNNKQINFSGYQDSIVQELQLKLSLYKQLPKAISNSEFSVFLQPIVPTDKLKTPAKHFESLIRWNHCDKGYLEPNQFIELAEKSGNIIELGYWFIDNVSQIINQFDKLQTGTSVSVSLSPLQLREPDIVVTIKKIIDNYGISPEQIIFEISEQNAMLDINLTKERFTQFSEAGFKLCISNFGSGYSSLFYLMNLPFNMLKIDKEFVLKANRNNKFDIIGASIVKIAQDLSLTAICEGIDQQDHLDMVTQWSADAIQGQIVSEAKSWEVYFYDDKQPRL
ncbi:MAG: EAL domain-containing protein, partial [Psychrobium sp.]